MSTRRPPRFFNPSTWRTRWTLGVAVVAGFLTLTAMPASAHPYLLQSSPAANSIVSASPAHLSISYTEGLDLHYCKVVLVGPKGQTVPTRVSAGSQSNTLIATPQVALTEPGTYAVEWTAVGDDGHTVIGVFAISFDHTSTNPDVVAGSAPSAGSSSQSPLSWLLHVLLPAFTVLLAGLLFFDRTVSGDSSSGDTGDDGGRRYRLLSRYALIGYVLATAGLLIQGLVDEGLHPVLDSSSGRRLVVQAALSVVAGLVLRLSPRFSPRLRRAMQVAVGVALNAVLVWSSHAITQPDSRRILAFAVYWLHLTAVSVWIGALITVLVAAMQDGALWGQVLRRQRVVALSLVAVLVTGVLNTVWALRSLGQIFATGYGLLIDAKFALFLGAVAAGALTVLKRRRLARTPEPVAHAGWARNGFRVELGLMTVALILGSVLGELPQPLDLPFASQEFATDVGLPTAFSVLGPYTAVSVVSPGTTGRNELDVRLTRPDDDDFLQDVNDIGSVKATIRCSCQTHATTLTLHANPGGPWWTAPVSLPVAAEWSFSVEFDTPRAGTASGGKTHSAGPRASFGVAISPAELPSQVVVGVPADLSGTSGAQCLDQTLGLQTALDDVNSQAVDHGNLVRLVAVDVHHNAGVAMARLLALHPALLALPCGTTQETTRIDAIARRHGIPVISTTEGPTSRGVWSLGPNASAEGNVLADQIRQQGVAEATVVSGSTAEDKAELVGLTSRASQLGEQLHVVGVPSNPDTFVTNLANSGSPCLVLLLSPAEASGVTAALSDLNELTNWVPARGILTSDQLMNTDYINDAGQISRIGELEIASTINPFDPVDMYYAQRLRTLVPGTRPTFAGVEGYNAGLTISAALRMGGGHPSPTALISLFSDKFGRFVSGSFRASWTSHGGWSTALSFFRPTYLNPMVMPAGTAGGVQAMAHEGTFLDAGGFEQVAPFRTLQEGK